MELGILPRMLAKKIAQNTIISIVSRILSTALALIIVGISTRYLRQDGFGYYSTVLAFLYIFSVLADLGLYSITLREISKEGANESEIASHAFSLRFWAGLAIFILSPLVAWLFPYPLEIKIGILIAAFGYWFLSSTQVLIGIFQKYLKMARVSLGEIIARVVQLGLVIFFFFGISDKKTGFYLVVLAFSLSSFANFLFVWISAQKYISVRFVWNISYWRKMLRESFPIALSAIFAMVYFKLDTVMLSLMRPVQDVGIYSVAYKIMESLIFFPALLVGLIMPLLSKYAGSYQAEFKRISQKGFEILLIFAIPLAIGGLILSRPIVGLIAGDDFSQSVGVLKILIFAAAIIFFGSLFSNMIIALGRQKTLAKIYALGAIVNFSINLFLIPRFSFWGAASSTLLTEALVTILMWLAIKKTADWAPGFGLSFKIILAAGLMAVSLYFFKEFNVLISLGLGLIIYFGALFAAGGISLKEILPLFTPTPERLAPKRDGE
ncbi:MAG: hypothetical protein A2174_02100 [Candidatus Portnoybacteria bacterium RBG_13_41_18]|uniref:Uncharacterized protein n=1 Tax=Candidatus Portnoybacteria bacterium RBG_13_41_18 TaxID=1801991 RepID=A0A1G2F6T5_9BACT|nr:MAG: hypothetical protein A2174_02100 [Candidatus Portnoybacteria bacterium RBG_13_41_18]